jgi:hypothetical protein
MNIPTLRSKIAWLQQQSDDASALRDAIHKAIQLCEARCNEAAYAARTAGTDEVRATALHRLEQLRGEHAQMVQQRQQRDATHRVAAQVFARVDGWLDRQRSDSRWRLVTSKKVAYTAPALEQIRQTIAELQAELFRVAASPLDRASIEAAVTQHVAALAASCRVGLTGERADSPFDIVFDAHTNGWHAPKPLEVLAWWDAKALTAKLLAAIPVTEGMSLADKRAATERLAADLLTAERSEEALIRAAHAGGTLIERRVDASPLAILGVAPDTEQSIRSVA